MRSCPGRLSPLGHGVLWPLFLAALIILLFTLPSFIKEPSTKPSRYQYIQDTKERFQKLLQKAVFQAPTTGQGASNLTVQVSNAPASHSEPTAHAAGVSRQSQASQAPGQQWGVMPGTPTMASLKRQEEDMPSPRGQDKMTSAKTKEVALQSQDMKTSGGREDQKGQGISGRPATAKPQGKAATIAKALGPGSRDHTLPTPRALSTKMREKAMAKAVGPAQDKAAQASPTPAPVPSPTTCRHQRLKAANFRSEPRWDFEEKYSLDLGSLMTTCPDSLKVRASKSPWLQNLFLPNLTLFLDSKGFNQSEWDRLEHFAPPFGFMELNHSLVEKVVTRFPPVPQQQLLLASLPRGSSQCVTCAVVGNGGILNNSHMGQEIDSHNYVFRLSGALIKGYEEDVGTRTSFYGFTAFSLTQSLLTLASRGFQHVPLGKDVRYLHFLEGTRDYEWLEAMLLNETLVKKNLFWFRHRPQEAFQEALRLDRYLLLHPDFLRYMKNRFLRSKTLDTAHWRIYRPTTGALLLLTALHLCDKVSAYGFITEGHERFSDHYYDKSWKRLIFYINHDFKLERAVWKQLHDEGIIWLYQRPQTTKAKD